MPFCMSQSIANVRTPLVVTLGQDFDRGGQATGGPHRPGWLQAHRSISRIYEANLASNDNPPPAAPSVDRTWRAAAEVAAVVDAGKVAIKHYRVQTLPCAHPYGSSWRPTAQIRCTPYIPGQASRSGGHQDSLMTRTWSRSAIPRQALHARFTRPGSPATGVRAEVVSPATEDFIVPPSTAPRICRAFQSGSNAAGPDSRHQPVCRLRDHTRWRGLIGTSNSLVSLAPTSTTITRRWRKPDRQRLPSAGQAVGTDCWVAVVEADQAGCTETRRQLGARCRALPLPVATADCHCRRCFLAPPCY